MLKREIKAVVSTFDKCQNLRSQGKVKHIERQAWAACYSVIIIQIYGVNGDAVE